MSTNNRLSFSLFAPTRDGFRWTSQKLMMDMSWGSFLTGLNSAHCGPWIVLTLGHMCPACTGRREITFILLLFLRRVDGALISMYHQLLCRSINQHNFSFSPAWTPSLFHILSIFETCMRAQPSLLFFSSFISSEIGHLLYSNKKVKLNWASNVQACSPPSSCVSPHEYSPFSQVIFLLQCVRI